MANQNLLAMNVVASTASVNGDDMTNLSGAGAVFLVNITTLTGTSPTLTFTIQGKHPVSGVTYTILTSAVFAATGANLLRVFPGLGAVANQAVNDILPRTFRVIAVTGGTVTNATYTVEVALVD